jgi:hypothetical protein
MFRITASLVCIFCVTYTAQAHPGHGNPAAQDGIQHYLTSPLHLIPGISVAVCAIAAMFLWRRTNRTQQPATRDNNKR